MKKLILLLLLVHFSFGLALEASSVPYGDHTVLIRVTDEGKPVSARVSLTMDNFTLVKMSNHEGYVYFDWNFTGPYTIRAEYDGKTYVLHGEPVMPSGALGNTGENSEIGQDAEETRIQNKMDEVGIKSANPAANSPVNQSGNNSKPSPASTSGATGFIVMGSSLVGLAILLLFAFAVLSFVSERKGKKRQDLDREFVDIRIKLHNMRKDLKN